MFKAINKRTGFLVNAIAIHKDTTYILEKEDIWYAPSDTIANYQEVLEKEGTSFIEVRYRKGSIKISRNNKQFAVLPHFYIPEAEKRGILQIAESIEHKAIKEFIFKTIIENPEFRFTFSKLNLKDKTLPLSYSLEDLKDYIDWKGYRESVDSTDFFERNITDIYNTKRVDVLIPFSKRHYLFGYGIALEVQLSSQSDVRTLERTIERALKGFSSVWVMKNDFIDYEDLDNLQLNNLNEVIIIPWLSTLELHSDKIGHDINLKIQEYSHNFDIKRDDTIRQIQNQLKILDDTKLNNEQSIKKLIDNYMEQLESNKEYLNKIVDSQRDFSKTIDLIIRDKLSYIKAELYEIKLDYHKLLATGQNCPTCKIGIITITKNRSGLYCNRRNDGCKFWVNL